MRSTGAGDHSPERKQAKAEADGAGEAALAARLLHDFLQKDAPLREAAIVRFTTFLALVVAIAAVALNAALGSREALVIATAMISYALLFTPLRRRLDRGWYDPVVPWLNVTVETSAVLLLYAVDLAYHGPVFALTGPTTVVWSTVIMLSALRANRRLALWAGGFATAEYLVLYFGWTYPNMQEPILPTLAPGPICERAAFLAMSGAFAATIADHLVRKTEEAFRAVREQDLWGKYLLHERIGSGGMAEVFRATYSPEGGFEKQVAIKRISAGLSEDEEFVALFRREAELGSLLAHPNVLQILDMGRHKGSYFMVLEFVEGLSLGSTLRAAGRPMSLAAVAFLGAELAEALEYIHQRRSPSGEPLRLIHRDVNPPNILISRHGDVKLADFGIARAATGASLTHAGVVRGKTKYMAPEQVAGQLDQRSDLFSLGLTLYTALTRAVPVAGETPDEIVRNLLDGNGRAPPPSSFRADVPPALDAVILGLLERDPERRIQSGKLLREAFYSLEGTAAPYPRGKLDLAELIQLAEKSIETTPTSLSGFDDSTRTQAVRNPGDSQPGEAATPPAATTG